MIRTGLQIPGIAGPTSVLSAFLAVSILSEAGAASPAAPTTQSPLEDFVHAVLEPGNAMMAQFDQRLTMARELLRIASDDVDASEFMQTNAVVYAAFGESYVHGQRFLGGVPELPGLVFTQSLSAQPIADFHEWAIDEAWIGLPNYGDMASVALYTARFGQGPEHIGVKVSIDHELAAGLSCAGELGCRSICYVPFDLIDPSSSISAIDAGDFLQASVRGDFDDPAALQSWFMARVVVPPVYAGNPGGGSDGAARACNEAALRECLAMAEAAHNAAASACAAEHGPKIAEAEKAVRDAARSFIAHVGAGAAGGGIAGALTGTAGGPLTPVTSLLGALLWGTVGAATGAIAWACGTDAEQAKADLENAKANAKAAACNVFRNTGAAMRNCFYYWCPDELENASIVADVWVASNGC